ncbi:hypothetical protein L3X38_035309 [Prunus dulcis]|uniref:Uncharacterized protein n=1 Tax=Prunus dulcis TaxID=3755 RepID=A0AAD4VJF3_PRUDU|nr:hypothetical protein L3X38_035309 [Prunus dulcis]
MLRLTIDVAIHHVVDFLFETLDTERKNEKSEGIAFGFEYNLYNKLEMRSQRKGGKFREERLPKRIVGLTMNHKQDIPPASDADDIGLGENWCALSDIEDLNAKVAGPSSYTFTAVSDSYVPPLGDTQIPVNTKLVTDCIVGNVDPLFL